MIKLLTIPGCSRARSIKQFANEMEVGIDEENVFRFLLDQEANASAIAAIADCLIDRALEQPGMVKSLIIVLVLLLFPYCIPCCPNQQILSLMLPSLLAYADCPLKADPHSLMALLVYRPCSTELFSPAWPINF